MRHNTKENTEDDTEDLGLLLHDFLLIMYCEFKNMELIKIEHFLWTYGVFNCFEIRRKVQEGNYDLAVCVQLFISDTHLHTCMLFPLLLHSGLIDVTET